jgi:hypothetical protein
MDGADDMRWLGLAASDVIEGLWKSECARPLVSVAESTRMDVADFEEKSVDVLALLLQVGLLTLDTASLGSTSAGGGAVAAAASPTDVLRPCLVPNQYARMSLLVMMGRALPRAKTVERASAIAASLRMLDAPRFEAETTVFLLALPYLMIKRGGTDREATFHAALWALLLCSVSRDVATIGAEVAVQGGRADIVISFTHEPVVWVFEVGLAADARRVKQEATQKLVQAERYAVAYAVEGVEVVCVSVIVNNKVRTASAAAASTSDDTYAVSMLWKRVHSAASRGPLTTLPSASLPPSRQGLSPPS